ncbi:MAG: glycoside hydrolase, partial [Mycobacteriales bacterium]
MRTLTRRQVLEAAAAATAGTAAAGIVGTGRARADYAIVVDPATNYGAWEGWGASLSWWAGAFGGDDTLADLFFTRGDVPYGGRVLPGLGLNLARYDVGACTWQPAGGQQARMVASPNIWRVRQTEGYWLDWYSADPGSASWNWAADATQRAMLGKARDRGVNLVEFFSCSPLWWMCLNSNPSGAADGGDNLQSWNYRQHAVYLATVAARARDAWGVPVTSVEPFNEPSASWWKANGTQEGCHVSPGIQEQVIGYLRTELDARGLTGVAVAASDENSYDAATATWTGFAAATRSRVGRVNVHGYQTSDTGAARRGLYAAVHGAGKTLWQSEYGEGYAHGLYLAYNLSADLRYLHPTAWCYWQPVDAASWGLVKATYTDP